VSYNEHEVALQEVHGETRVASRTESEMDASSGSPRYLHSGVPIAILPRDASMWGRLGEYAVTLHTDAKPNEQDKSSGFYAEVVIDVPRLDHLIAASDGNFCDLALDLQAEAYAHDESLRNRVRVYLRGKAVDERILQRWYRRNQLFIPLWMLYEDSNALRVVVDPFEDGTTALHRHNLDIIVTSKERVLDILETGSIWIFSSPRSGSTWLAQDILGWLRRARPMDETFLGRILSPLEMQPERFYRIDDRAAPFESGWDFETQRKPRTRRGTPPFQRHLSARTERMEQLLSSENGRMFRKFVRALALEHVLGVWGLLGYQRVIFKNPTDAQGAELIMQALPNSHMIFLMRDGRDVLRSTFSPFVSQELAETTDAALRRYAVAFYAHHWNFQIDIIRSAYDAHAPDRRIFIRYEDLRHEPHRVIGPLLTHLGMEISGEELVQLVHDTTLENLPAETRGPDKPRQSGLVGGYQAAFSADEIQLMNSIMGDNLRRYGYLTDGGSTFSGFPF
jgi:hypothetical protein